MLFVTNRFPRQSLRSRTGRRFTFDTSNNAASNSLFFCAAGPEEAHVEIGSPAFFERLRDTPCRQILLYVHGFNTPPAGALERARHLQALADALQPGEVEVVALIWPTDDDPGVLRDYWDDQRSADLSGYAFARAFAKFVGWQTVMAATPCLKRINIIAHSMGTRVLRQGLYRWAKDDLPDGVPLLFRNTFLIASDVVNETLEEGHTGALMCHASRNVVVYHATDDLALRASKAANLRNRIASRRLGHTGPQHIDRCPPNVYSIDCDDMNLRYDPGMGHSYFFDDPDTRQPGRVFEHMFQVIAGGRVFAGDLSRRAEILTA